MRHRLVVAIALVLSAPATADTVAISADHMVDVLAGRVTDKPMVIVKDGRITAVGTQGSLTVPEGAKHIDLPGKTILPGLIDMHVHLTSLAEIGGYRTLQYTDSFWGAVSVANAKKTLNAGFTTVRNVGSADFQDVGLREAIDGGCRGM